MNINCIKCKGNNPRANCGRDFCPILAKSNAMFKTKQLFDSKDNSNKGNLGKTNYFGASPAVFVGRFGYPNINVGILTPPNITNSDDYDAPRTWGSENYDINTLINIRSSLVNSRFKMQVKYKKEKFLDMTQEISMASKPVDVEINLKDKPYFTKKNDPEVAPMGPTSALKKAQITSNPKIHTKVDKVVSDTSLKATQALELLYKKNFDENFLSKLLSAGNLGVKTQRKLVPTRWSITATDDHIGKMYLKEIHKLSSRVDYSVYFGDYLGNYYLILMFPEIWSYELFEMYLPKASWNPTNQLQFSTDNEGYLGRKNYASNCVGGYYSVRMAVQEHLVKKEKKQASCLVLRFITGEYAVPLGVWVTREAARQSLKSRPLKFASKELMLKYAQLFIKKKFNIDINQILNKSIMLNEMKIQKKLNIF
tara:strand:+ start:1148 stop:2419 length:1272 start_codon:yes stop_codon:yes gene_type:complete